LPKEKQERTLPPETPETTGQRNLPDERELKKYRIKRIPVDYFHYREFRYTNLADAIAQAKRDEASQEREDRHGNRKSCA
jgi:hypothetical protein